MRGIDPAYQDRHETDRLVRRMLLAGLVVCGIYYFAWRTTVFSPEAPVASGLFYAVELLGFLSSLLLFFVTGEKRVRQPRQAPPGLTVDVFIPTLNEDIAVVRRTLVAALRMRYPHETWLLDDGNRPQFRRLAAELGCRYLARTENKGAKAGNLNNALRHATGELVVLFDADHCAEPVFLERLIGYFEDSDVAFVQTPQDYYNLGSFQHGRDRASGLIWHEQSGFHHIEQPGRDHHDAATLCGCSCILRRSHLDRIGGFPEETVTEDMHAAVKLQKLGLKTVYHGEPLAYGVAAPDLNGFVLQRLRWGEGNMQVCRAEGLPFARELTWKQNLCYLLLSTVYVESWRKLILFLAPPLTVLMQVPPVAGQPDEFALAFVPYFLFGLGAYYAAYGSFARIFDTEAFALARMSSGLLATWGLFRRRIPFRVASKKLIAKSSLVALLPTLLVLVVSLLAIADYAHRVEANWPWPPGGIPIWIEASLVALCVVHAALALRVLHFTRRVAGQSETNFAHAVRLPVLMTDAGGRPHWAWTRRVSVDGASIGNADAPWLGRASNVQLLLPDAALDLHAAISSGADRDGAVHLDFDWPGATARDDLDQMLHAARWHRVVEGRAELVARPSWWPLVGPAATRVASRWEPVVVTGGAGRPELAYVAHRAGATEVILFGATAGSRRAIVASFSGTLDGHDIVLLPGPAGPLLDEGAIRSVGGRRLTARLVRRQPVDALPVAPEIAEAAE